MKAHIYNVYDLVKTYIMKDEEDKIMQYEIVGKTVPAVEITLDRGESMYTQSGGMIWQTEGIEMKTNTKGGLMK